MRATTNQSTCILASGAVMVSALKINIFSQCCVDTEAESSPSLWCSNLVISKGKVMLITFNHYMNGSGQIHITQGPFFWEVL